MDEKDRFGDKLREKERADEDRYFAEQDRAALEKLRAAREQQSEAALRDFARGRCPKCGERLATIEIDRISVERCSACGGVWLDDGELQALSRRQHHEGWLAHLFRQRIGETR